MVRMTKQKRMLFHLISVQKTFFDAAELHEKAVKIDYGVSVATVYRFLKGLEHSGGVHSFLCDSRKIYSMQTTNHTHFRCEKCGLVTHVVLKNVDFLRSQVGFEVCHFQLEMVGVCESCLSGAK